MDWRKPIKGKNKTKLVSAVAGLALLAVLGIAATVFPGFENRLFDFLGISSEGARLDAGVESPTGIHFVDVGQGDAVLIEQDGEFALIDAGPPEGTDELLRYLETAGVEKLKYIFMTHPHADHYGGMEKAVRRFGADKLLMPNFNNMPPPTTVIFVSLLEYLSESGVKVESVIEGQEFILGNGKIRVVQSGLPGYDDYNIISTALMFEAGGMRYFSTGDAEKPNEKAMVQDNLDIKADLYKAAHHGSKTSNTWEFLNRISPDLIVICCAENNSYGHPHKSVMERFEKTGAVILSTAYNGSVVVRPDGSGGLAYGVRKAG